MTALAKSRVSVLAEMVQRALVLGSAPDSDHLLSTAFDRGLTIMTTQADRRDGGVGLVDEVWPEIARPARFDILRHRAHALTERSDSLGQAVATLAAESLGLHDRLWQAHEHATRLKVMLGRLQTVRVRPDPPATIGSGGGGRRRREATARLLAGVARQAVTLTLPVDAPMRARAAAERLDWADERFDDALLVTVAHGLPALEVEAGRGAVAAGGAPALEALSHRVFELLESIRVLGIRENAFRIDNRGMRLRLDQLEREIAELEQAAGERGLLGQQNGSGAAGGLEWLGRLLRRPKSER